MESAAYNSMDRLCEFLHKFLPTNDQDPAYASEAEDASRQVEEDAAVSSTAKAEHMQGACIYCGGLMGHMPIDIGGFQDNICTLCKEESVWQRNQIHQIVDEAIRNMKYMCSIPWNKTIRVQKCSELKKTGLQAAKAKRKISTTWAVSLEPQFVQANMDDARGICIFKIRNAIPEGIVVASAAYIAAYGWLCIIDENQRLDRERMAGLSYWYMVHYLHCMDYERYGSHYDQIIERLIPKAGVMLYRELKEKRHNLSNRVFSILRDLILVQQQEGNRLTTVRQTEDKTASDTHNAGSG